MNFEAVPFPVMRLRGRVPEPSGLTSCSGGRYAIRLCQTPTWNQRTHYGRTFVPRRIRSLHGNYNQLQSSQWDMDRVCASPIQASSEIRTVLPQDFALASRQSIYRSDPEQWAGPISHPGNKVLREAAPSGTLPATSGTHRPLICKEAAPTGPVTRSKARRTTKEKSRANPARSHPPTNSRARTKASD